MSSSQNTPASPPSALDDSTVVQIDEGNVVAECEDLEQQLSHVHISPASSTEQLESPALINRLPIEILVEIFRWAEFLPEHIISSVLRLASVCRHWRRIIIGTPVLWACFPAFPVNLAHLCMERSQQAPIHYIIICYRKCPRCNLYEHFSPPTALLSANILRVRGLVLRIDGEAYSRLLEHLAPLTAPCLEYLELRVDPEYSTSTDTSLSQRFTSRRFLDALGY